MAKEVYDVDVEVRVGSQGEFRGKLNLIFVDGVFSSTGFTSHKPLKPHSARQEEKKELVSDPEADPMLLAWRIGLKMRMVVGAVKVNEYPYDGGSVEAFAEEFFSKILDQTLKDPEISSRMGHGTLLQYSLAIIKPAFVNKTLRAYLHTVVLADEVVDLQGVEYVL